MIIQVRYLPPTLPWNIAPQRPRAKDNDNNNKVVPCCLVLVALCVAVGCWAVEHKCRTGDGHTMSPLSVATPRPPLPHLIPGVWGEGGLVFPCANSHRCLAMPRRFLFLFFSLLLC